MDAEFRLPEMGDSLADLHDRLDGVPLGRIRLQPPLGRAKEKDVLAARREPERWLFELVEGCLILKAPGLVQSILSGELAYRIMKRIKEEELGICLGASAMYRLSPGLVRIPDFSFVSWARLPGGQIPDVEIADFVPDLVADLPRPSNSEREIERKVHEYLDAGVRLVWIVRYPEQTATEYTASSEARRVMRDGELDGGEVLPGLRLSLPQLFAKLRRGEDPS